jgi:hypothetical protein
MIDDKTADGLLNLLRQQRDRDLDARAGLALFHAADEFTIKTGTNEFFFIDRALRVCVGALFKLDPAATRDYVTALMDRIAPDADWQVMAEADVRRLAAFERLYEALKCAGAEPARRGRDE